MSKSSNSITDQLAEVAGAGDAAEANTAGELAEGLQEVADAASETDANSNEESGSKGRGAQDRIQELVSQKNELSTNLEALQSQYEESQRSIANLTDMLTSSREDSELIQGIRNLAVDPKNRPMLEQLEAALRGEGIEDKPVEGETSEQAAERRAKLIEQKIEEQAAEAAEIRSDQLVTRADQIADHWLAGLPNEYTQEDRDVVSHLWAGLVDWDLLESQEDPMAELEPYLKETFQQAVDIFKTPRGSLVEPQETQEELEPVKSPEEQLAEIISSRNYGAMKKEGEVYSPEFSDDDFTSDLAAAMKIANSGG